MLAVVVAGHRASSLLWEWEQRDGAEPPGPLERTSATVVMAIAVAISVDWTLALLHLFTVTGLTVASVLLLAVSLLSSRQALVRSVKEAFSADLKFGVNATLFTVAALVPVLAWIIYVAWRGAVCFVSDHDGLGYHMPKALLVVRAHGYGYFDGSMRAIPTFPMNHELLLANVIALTGADEITEWVSAAMFLALGLVAGGAIERWWGSKLAALTVMLLTWAMPVALLHSASHKNDLLFATCTVAALAFGARWATAGGRGALIFGLAGMLMAGGTKVSGAFVVVGMAPAVVVRFRTVWKSKQRPSVGRIVATLALALGMSLALGWAMFILNYVNGGHIVDTRGGGYGAWSQIWMLGCMLVARPFSGPVAAWIPWQNEYWFYPKHDLCFSTLGMATSLMIVATPVGLFRYRKLPDAGLAGERIIASIGALIIFLGIAPAEVHPPFGFFVQHTRYVMFLTPIVAAWTVAPLIRELAAKGALAALAARGGVVLAAVTFGYEAVSAGRSDPYDTFDFFVAVLKHPDELARTIPIGGGRSAVWADAHAGPDDRIAFDGELTSWPYPLYGRERRREVTYFHPENGPVTIPDDVTWVVIDREWNALFNNPRFVDLGDWGEIGKGVPTDVDLEVFRTVSNDPRFRRVYWEPRTVQAVFKRVVPP